MTDTLTQVASHLTNRPLSGLTVVAAMAFGDGVIGTAGLWVAAYSIWPAAGFAPFLTLALACLCAAVFVGLNIAGGAYKPQALARLLRSFVGCLPGMVLLLALPFPLGLATGSVLAWLGICMVTVLPGLVVLRLLAGGFVRWAQRFGALERRAIIAGGGDRAAQVIRALAQTPDNDIRVTAIFDDRDDDRAPPQTLGVPNIGRFEDVMRFVELAEIDLVLITFPLEAESRINWILTAFKSLPHRIHLVDFADGFAFDHGGELGFVLARDGSYDVVRRWQKRAIDLVLGSVALVLLSPVMALAALAVRLESSGPVMFIQPRHGFANRTVPVLKFRSMYHDMQDATGTDVVKRGGDARVTRVGAILRKTSIDELPQLFCVLRGDLSLVGPRPHALDARSSSEEAFTALVEDYAARHRLPPGITGWAQINGLRGGIERPEQIRARVAHDLHYIENWSIWLDLRILLRTPLAVFKSQNAY
ncbi:MAG: exopolysaccharide biosynthesis polyprenyl glycosylphosphotransferase [Pseudomonadota bacterium]